MLRRRFLALAGGTTLLLPTKFRLLGDSILVSANPLISEFNLQSQVGRYTPTEDFYVRNHFPIPEGSGSDTLSIEGEVQQPVKVSLGGLARLKTRELGAVLECSGNGTGPQALASNGYWEGCALGDVLALARPMPKATHLHLVGRDGFARSIPTAEVGPDAMLVTRLNHEPLTPEHGAPWRALFPGRYGMNSVKWLDKIVLSPNPLPPETDEYRAQIRTASGRSEYQPLPRMLVKSVIMYPARGVILHPGSVTLRGLAWSGIGKIAAVEVSLGDTNTWRLAKLDAGTPYEWALWQYTVKVPGPGVLNVASKAVDETGSAQPPQRDPNRLDGYAINVIERVHYLIE
jgi:DMSO/TMAO reductase YedYZ molybdopterin-dependent catalytic subunit